MLLADPVWLCLFLLLLSVPFWLSGRAWGWVLLCGDTPDLGLLFPRKLTWSRSTWL